MSDMCTRGANSCSCRWWECILRALTIHSRQPTTVINVLGLDSDQYYIVYLFALTDVIISLLCSGQIHNIAAIMRLHQRRHIVTTSSSITLTTSRSTTVLPPGGQLTNIQPPATTMASILIPAMHIALNSTMILPHTRYFIQLLW